MVSNKKVNKAAPVKAEEVKAAPKAAVKVNPAKAEAPVKAEVKAEVKAAKEEVKAAVAKVEAKAEKAVEKKAEVKKAAEKKETAKKAAPAKKAAEKKTDVKISLSVQFDGKSYTTDDLVKIAKDVWKYDLKQKAADFKSVDLYVKPEEGMAYYVVNGKEAGGFYI